MSDDKGIGSGPVLAFAKILLRKANIQAEFVPMPWARIIQKETLIPNNLILSISKTESRREDYIWLTKIYDEQQYVWQRRNYSGKRSSIGVERDSYKVPFLNEYFGETNVVKYLNTDLAVLAMYKGNIDHYVGPVTTMKFKLERLELDFSKIEIKEKFHFSTHQGLHLAMTNNSSKVIVDKIMAALNETEVKRLKTSLSRSLADQHKSFLAQVLSR